MQSCHPLETKNHPLGYGRRWSPPPPPIVPAVQSVELNPGATFPDSRSMITIVRVTFSTTVDHVALAAAFTVTNITDAVEATGLIITPSDQDGKTVADITFGLGSATVQSRVGTGLQGNTLTDGNYRLDIDAASVLSSTETPMTEAFVFGGQVAADDPNDDFFRLLGDTNGDGFRNGIDQNAIIAALFNPPNYREDLDTNGDGFINGIDQNDLIPTIYGSPRP